MGVSQNLAYPSRPLGKTLVQMTSDDNFGSPWHIHTPISFYHLESREVNPCIPWWCPLPCGREAAKQFWLHKVQVPYLELSPGLHPAMCESWLLYKLVGCGGFKPLKRMEYSAVIIPKTFRHVVYHKQFLLKNWLKRMHKSETHASKKHCSLQCLSRMTASGTTHGGFRRWDRHRPGVRSLGARQFHQILWGRRIWCRPEVSRRNIL